MNSNYTMVLAPGSIYKCLYISHYKINLGKLIQETEWPFSVQRPHRRQPSPKNSFSPWNLVTASLQPPNRTFSELAICKSSSPSQKYISSAYRQEWQNGVRTWRRVTCFFFSSEALQRRRWHGSNDGSSLGWGKRGCCCDENTGVHQVYRRSESGPNQETQTRELPLWLNFYLILVKSWTFSGPRVPAK